MKRETEKSLNERWCIVANLDSVQARLASHKGMISLREWWLSVVLRPEGVSKGSPECSSLAPPVICLANQAGVRGVSKPQSATGQELRPLFGRTLLPSVLDRAFST